MENPRKVDRSFKERLSVISLLEKLGRDDITYAEMDEIGVQLKKAGISAVQPIIRRLWKEKSGILISKYTYLLDFLDDQYWLDHIVQIALKRRDLGAEGSTAIMATLESCGVDITVPPFSALLAGHALSVSELASRIIDKGDEGQLAFLEEFALVAEVDRERFLLEIATVNDLRILDALSVLLWHWDDMIVKMAVAAVSRLRFQASADILAAFLEEADPSLEQAIKQSLRRLQFVGISPGSTSVRRELKPFHSAYAGPLDGNGYRHVSITRWSDTDSLVSVDFQIHDLNGVSSVWGAKGESPAAYEQRAADRLAQEMIEPITPEYALQLLRNALLRNRESGTPLPMEFLLYRSLFSAAEVVPEAYQPGSRILEIKISPAMITQSVQLFDDEFFAGWALESCNVYDMAEEWIKCEKTLGTQELNEELERMIETLCREEILPSIDEISDRLYMNADFMMRTGSDLELVNAAVAAAASIRQFSLPCHLHPFLRRFALESMVVAREALEEGYDLRDFSGDIWE